jgi:hypothetical protein
VSRNGIREKWRNVKNELKNYEFIEIYLPLLWL